MCVEATAHRTLGNAFYVSLFRAVVDVVLFFVTSGEHSDSGHCPPFFGGGNILRQGLMYCFKKVRLPLPVNNVCDHPIHPSSASLTVALSIAQLYMTANFHSFSVAFIMDRHLLRSAASSVRKLGIQQARRKNNNKPITLTVKWGGSFLNFWKCKQTESFVRQIIITRCQIMKGGRWVQMSGKKRGRMEVGGMESVEIFV